MRRHAPSPPSGSPGGFTLIEMIIVVFLLALAMLGLLSVFDASARINKSESDVADAQGAVRYGIYSMTRAIRMAGSGGLYVTQAVLNKGDGQLTGIIAKDVDYDNVPDGTKVISLNGEIPVRAGTDMIEIRGVINSPLVGFDLQTGCEPCNPPEDPASGCSNCVGAIYKLTAKATTSLPHVNHDVSNRPQFSQIDAYTAGVSPEAPMLVLVSFNDDIHTDCAISDIYPLYPQTPYNVGVIHGPTTLTATPATFGVVDFTDTDALEFNTETPAEVGTGPIPQKNVRHAGILDDLIFFIDNSNPAHPALAQGTRRGQQFDVVTLADDVEDMQIAYGVDTNGNYAIDRLAARDPVTDPDFYVSSQPKGDEWVPNVAGANDNPISLRTGPFLATDFYALPFHCPRLHAVMISLVAKSRDPDPTYKAPSAAGFLTMNSPALTAPPPNPRSYPAGSTTTFRRRVQTLKINLRNYAYQGSGP